MTSIERTAYPRFKRTLSARDLADIYTPTAQELAFVSRSARTSQLRLNLMVLLKAFGRLGYFPLLSDVPPAIVDHIRTAMRLPPTLTLFYPVSRTMRYHQHAIRVYLQIASAGRETRRIAARAVYQAAQTMDTPADLINVAIEALIKAQHELPAFSTLDRLTARVRTLVNQHIFARIGSQITPDLKLRLDGLLDATNPRRRSDFIRVKQTPKKATRDNLNDLETHLTWLSGLGDMRLVLAGIQNAKIQHFAAEARALDAASLRDFADPKRYALLTCMLQQAQVTARDNLVDMFIKYVRNIHTRAKEALDKLHDKQRDTTERLLSIFAEVMQTTRAAADDTALGQEIRQLLIERGGVEQLLAECAAMSIHNGNNYLPLLPKIYRGSRQVLFRLLTTLEIVPANEDRTLSSALDLLRTLFPARSDCIPATISLEFASELWQRTVLMEQGKRKKKRVFVRRLFEMCVFTYLARELKAGDMAVVGSEKYADYREQLVPWNECQRLLDDYCAEVDVPRTAHGLLLRLWLQLKAVAETVDAGYQAQDQLTIDDNGRPSLKRLLRKEQPQELATLEATLAERLEDRTVLDILCNVAHWTEWPRHFGPLSGSEPKLEDALAKYIATTFCYGTNLGPAQTAKHMPNTFSAQTLSMINRQHISTRSLEAARRDMINGYHTLTLPKVWGSDAVAGVDGTQFDLAEENLVAEFSIRYRSSGGIAYHHISDQYIALFVHFITCGTWEAIFIIDGLLKNTSEIQPTTIHGDTQAQSTPVFALTHLMGIDLMPRIRNWKDIIFFKPSKEVTYQHIEPLFRGVIDWNLIETHWQDMLQVVISIKEGKLLASTVLQKLGHDSQKNKLYRAFRELGRVIRTIFLLRYISELNLRRQITATTNKVEAYNGFSDWLFFGGDGVIETNDPVEQEKRMHYKDLVANTVIFQNTVDITAILRSLQQEGVSVRRDTVAMLSPYLTRHIRRYGDYVINVENTPAPINNELDMPDA
jgi:TnpA family transposase